MKARHHGLDTHAEDPFKECKLKRKQHALILTKIVQNYKDGFVLAVNNPWGTGKTTFVKMWRQHLENEKFRAIYFNAWENDLQESVFVALLSELGNLDKATKAARGFQSVVDKSVPILAAMLPSLAKAAAGHVIGNETVKTIAEGTAKGVAAALDKELKDYQKRRNDFEAFQEKLTEFVRFDNNGKPLVFIIDELDRCRPNYAVTVLENIKHLFSVPGIVFVLSIDKEQLGHAVRGVYGSEQLDAQEYLRRFIDLEYSLPVPDYSAIMEYFYNYFEFYQVFPATSGPKKELLFSKVDFIFFTSFLVSSKQSNLRTIERMMSRLRVVASLISEHERNLMLNFFHLIFIHTYHNEQWKACVEPEDSVKLFLDIVSKISGAPSETTQVRRPFTRVMGLFFAGMTSYHNKLVVEEKLTFTHPLITDDMHHAVSYILRASNWGDIYSMRMERMIEVVLLTDSFGGTNN